MRIITDAELVVAVAEAVTLRAAAERLGLAQSNVTRRLTAMEQRLGTPLFARTRRGAMPTEAGLAYVGHARVALAAARAAEDAVGALIEIPKGTLTIAAPLAFGRRVVAQAAASYASRHPGIRLDLRLGDLPLDLAASNVDVAVRLGRVAPETLVTRRLLESRLMLVGAPVYLSGLGPLTHPHQLSRAACVVVGSAAARRLWPLSTAPGRPVITVEVPASHVADDVEAALTFCLAGLGVSLLPDWLVLDAIAAGGLANAAPGWSGPRYDAYIVLPLGRNSPSKTRAFVDDLTRSNASVPR